MYQAMTFIIYRFCIMLKLSRFKIQSEGAGILNQEVIIKLCMGSSLSK